MLATPASRRIRAGSARQHGNVTALATSASGTWERRPVPRRTIFVKGNDEDVEWLDAQISDEILPGLFYLRNGRTIDLGEGLDAVRVGGIGGCYSPSDYARKSRELQGVEKVHYARDEIDALGRRDGIDIMLLHEAPAGVGLDAGHTSEAAGLRELIERAYPMACFFGHRERIDVKISGVLCLGLDLVGRSGNLFAFAFARRRQFEGLGER